MIKSVCCEAAVREARSAGGWWIRGEIVTKWYECTVCKEACDTEISQTMDGDKVNE